MKIQKTYLLNFLVFSLISFSVIFSCRKNENDSAMLRQGSISFRNTDLPEIRKRGKLVALTDNSTTSYFIYKGAPMGYEYELLSMFAKHIGVNLEIVIVKNMDDIIELLLKGEGDIIAANLTVTDERSESVNFTEHHMLTRQVLVQRKPGGWKNMSYTEIEKALIRNPVKMSGKDIHVRKKSSFYTRLQNLSDEIGGRINIKAAPGNYETEFLIKLVAEGEIDYTVADENVAMVNKSYYPDIDIKTSISFPQKIAWAVNKESVILLRAVNQWMEDVQKTTEYAFIYNKYFKNLTAQKDRVNSEYFSQAGGKISKYDHIIKTYSREIQWDWRLLASLIYQESNFNPSAVSWAGASGLMQLMPSTAMIYGVDSLSTDAQNIKAGTKHIAWLDKYWINIIPEKTERIKFVLASYNAGLGHIIDARNLAIKYGKDPDVWDNNVSYFIVQKSHEKFYTDIVVKHGYCRGDEPYNYVKQILNRYEHYKNVES